MDSITVPQNQIQELFSALLDDEYGVPVKAYNLIWQIAQNSKEVYDAINALDEKVTGANGRVKFNK